MKETPGGMEDREGIVGKSSELSVDAAVKEISENREVLYHASKHQSTLHRISK